MSFFFKVADDGEFFYFEIHLGLFLLVFSLLLLMTENISDLMKGRLKGLKRLSFRKHATLIPGSGFKGLCVACNSSTMLLCHRTIGQPVLQ